MKELFERLENSEEFKKFKEEYPDAYFCTAFFVIGTKEESKKQLNYCISDTEVMAFDLTADDKITPLKLKTVKTEKSSKINQGDIKVSAEQAVRFLEKHAGKKFSKVIAVLQKLNGEPLWNLTCMDGFQLTRFHVSSLDGKVHDLKSINIRDMMRVEKKDKETGERVEIKLPENKPENTPENKEENKEIPAEETKQETRPDYVQ